jgi:chemotaxis protein CheZ
MDPILSSATPTPMPPLSPTAPSTHNADAVDTAGSAEVYQQIGLMTRQLHDTLQRLGVMPKLQNAAAGLPDARSRLSYIAQKCGDAADRVLTSVELAKTEHRRIIDASRRIAAALGPAALQPAEPGVDPAGAVREALAELDAARGRADSHLTDIMLAQDYHDLTGQVVAKVVSLAIELEDGLLALLLRAAPPESPPPAASAALQGPAIDARGRPDVVADQSEVDDLLASLGF